MRTSLSVYISVCTLFNSNTRLAYAGQSLRGSIVPLIPAAYLTAGIKVVKQNGQKLGLTGKEKDQFMDASTGLLVFCGD